jgi:nitroreductase
MSQILNVSAPQTLDLLRSRRSGSAKAMTGPGPSPEQVRTLVTCASRVPDHGKLAPWRFIVFEGDARRRFGDHLVAALQQTEPTASEERITQEQNRLMRAPVVIAVISRVRKDAPIPEWEQILSAGASCQTLLIAAHAMGFVAGWITEWYAYDASVREVLGLQEGERVAGFIYIGQPANALEDRPRPALDTIMSFFPSV